jgi:cytosine/adenosine deaminase-related metal-dependent hydrolase
MINEENIYSTIIYSSSRENVESVFIDGREVVRNGESLVYDKEEIFSKAKSELKELLNRSSIN